MRQIMLGQVMNGIGKEAAATSSRAWATPLAAVALALAIVAAGAGLRAIQSAEAASPAAAVSPAGYGTLSPAPGVRLARIGGADGLVCFHASRQIADEGRTIDKTFCQH